MCSAASEGVGFVSREVWAHEDGIGAAGIAGLIFKSLQRITGITGVTILLPSKSGYT